MGAHGATAASETADVVILKDDLSKVSQAVEIAQDTMKIAKQSVLIGIFICVLLMLIASTGIIPALIGLCYKKSWTLCQSYLLCVLVELASKVEQLIA